MNKVKVLIIEDDEDDFIIMKHYLSKIQTVEYDVYWSNDFDHALEDILANEHDIYLIDHFLGKGEGIEIIEQVRARNIMKPLILLTGAGNIQVDEKAMEKGASDFIVKTEVKVDTLERSLRYALDRYQQQRYIQEQERKYRSLFELSMEPLLILDEEFKIIEFNNAFQSAFENLPKSPLMYNFKDLFEYVFDFEAVREKVLKNGFIRGFKTTFVSDDNPYVAIISLARLNTQFGKSNASYQVVINDVTKLMEAQEELQKMEKLSMTGRMARMIAHEVRNPLTNINLAVGELEEVTKGVEDAPLYQEMISRNASRISTLIDELLKSARPTELELTQTHLEEVLDSAIEFCKDRIDLKEIDFKKVYPDKEVSGKWDPEKLKIAFVNIMINAIEAMADTLNPSLKVLLTEEDERPVVYIKDNGKGMDAATVNKIFDPFFSQRPNGLGLGMTATLNIISMHNGKINVNSALGKGTEFKITL